MELETFNSTFCLSIVIYSQYPLVDPHMVDPPWPTKVTVWETGKGLSCSEKMADDG